MDLAILVVGIIVLFLIFVLYWNSNTKGKILDEREMALRLLVRLNIARAVEIALVLAICFHFYIRPLTGLEALTTIGLTGILSEAFSNWYVRRES